MAEAVERVLKDKSLRITPVRKFMLKHMMEHHGPHNASELFEQAREKLDVDLATIYRSLKTFEDAKVVRSCELGDGSIRYEFSERSSHHHHHVVCRSCHRVDVVEECVPENIAKAVQLLGYSEIGHRLEFSGICSGCESSEPK